MAQSAATFAGFLALQVIFHAIERWWHRREAKGVHHWGFVVWFAHPTVIGGTHDWMIYLVTEAHSLLGGGGH